MYGWKFKAINFYLDFNEKLLLMNEWESLIGKLSKVIKSLLFEGGTKILRVRMDNRKTLCYRAIKQSISIDFKKIYNFFHWNFTTPKKSIFIKWSKRKNSTKQFRQFPYFKLNEIFHQKAARKKSQVQINKLFKNMKIPLQIIYSLFF